MASSRNFPPDLVARLTVALEANFPAGTSITVALSGGVDSVVLLHALVRVREARPLALCAHHVHHGLSPHADAWLDFCAKLCARLDLPFSFTRLALNRGPQQSLEALAREERHAALRGLNCDVLALAHHADDQAETLLLQLLRGAGVAGLAAMPPLSAGRPMLWRPLLDHTRAEIEFWARENGIDWIEDESNADLRFKRNFLRHEIAPRLAAGFAGYPQALARSARHCASADALLGDLAELDGLSEAPRGGLALDSLRRLPLPRAANLLRHFFRREGLRAPSEARLGAFLQTLREARPGARCELRHEGRRLVCHRGLVQFRSPPVAAFDVPWAGEARVELPHGLLEFRAAQGEGLSAAKASAMPCRIACRQPGARLRLHASAQARSLKNLFQEAGIAAWERESWPLVYCGGELAAVPGIGVAAAFQCSPDEPGWQVVWRASALS
jgi:tRNA(Ile)-lysidine synthase